MKARSSMTKVLVQAPQDLLVGHLCRRLQRDGHEVFELKRADGDIVEQSTFRNLNPVDHVFHLASRTFVPTVGMISGAFWEQT